MPKSVRKSGGDRRRRSDPSLGVIDARSRTMSARDRSAHQHAQRVEASLLHGPNSTSPWLGEAV